MHSVKNDAKCQLLLQHGARLDACDNEIRTSLHMAAMCGYENIEKVCMILLQHDAIIDALDKLLRTPLSYAADGGSKNTCLLLIQCGANKTMMSVDCNTPLDYAKYRQNERIILMLSDSQPNTYRSFCTQHCSAKKVIPSVGISASIVATALYFIISQFFK